MSASEDLENGIQKLGLEINENTRKKLIHFLELLVKWNKVYNLTAIRDPRQMVSNHLLDSLAVEPYLWGTRWLDVGCGGGLPGLVLAILHPEWKFTMIDSNSKKTGFVQQAVIELGLKNVQVICTRVEELTVEEKFDGIISRAFAELAEFIKLTRHLIDEHGAWAAMKGIPEKELLRVPDDCAVKKVITLNVPGLNAARSLVVARLKGERQA